MASKRNINKFTFLKKEKKIMYTCYRLRCKNIFRERFRDYVLDQKERQKCNKQKDRWTERYINIYYIHNHNHFHIMVKIVYS